MTTTAPRCPIEGEITEIKPGQLYQITQPGVAGGKAIALWNCTDDVQFRVTFEFQSPDVEALDAAPDGADAYTTNVYPCECKFVVRGTWKAFRKKLTFGAPDKAWQEAQARRVRAVIEAEVAAVHAVREKLPSGATDEGVAQACIIQGVPFVDPSFPPEQASIARPFEQAMPVFPWMRPAAYCPQGKTPTLFEGLVEPCDIDQGTAVGNCYLMCALACISEFPELVRDSIFAQPQCPSVGVYRANVYQGGWFLTVVVDDIVPVSGATLKPVFARNREEPNEIWVSALEKVSAKMYGSYAALRSGDPAAAMSDFLGTPYEKFRTRPEWSDPDRFFDFLLACDQADHLMALFTPGVDISSGPSPLSGNGSFSAAAVAATAETNLATRYKSVGLVTGHAFSLIKVARTSGGERLCMIRNPWGNAEEWNGDWSDNDPRWTPELQKEVGFVKADDGTFWMSWSDVLTWFDGGSVNYRVTPERGWSQVRVRATVAGGVPSVIMRIETTKPVKAWFGAHQADPRGRAPANAQKLLGVLLTVLRVNSATGKVERVASNGQNFTVARDVFAEAPGLEPSGGSPYFVLAQAFQDDARPIVLSAFFSHHDGVSVTFVALDANPEARKRFNPPTKFDPTLASNAADPTTEYQKATSALPKVASRCGTGVDWLATPTEAIPALSPPAVIKHNAAAVSSAGTNAKTRVDEDCANTIAMGGIAAAAGGGGGGATLAQPPVTKLRKAQDPNAEIYCGFLEKFSTGRSGGLKSLLPSAVTKNWKKRFFRLTRSGVLRYYEGEGASEALGEVRLRGDDAVTSTLISRASFEHHPNAEATHFDFLVKITQKSDGSSWTLLLRADSADAREGWVSKAAIGGMVDTVA